MLALTSQYSERCLRSAWWQWEQHNPPGFRYGDEKGRRGGEYMREAGVAELSTAPSHHFLNAYCTSSLAEDKAEVYACMMCYKEVRRESLQPWSLLRL